MASLASRERLSFSKLREVLELPDLIAVQRESFEWFLEQGVAEVLADISPIEDFTGQLKLELVRPHLRPAEVLGGRVPRARHDLRAPAVRHRAVHERADR